MAILEETINQAISDFDDIKAAIEECGVDVPYDTDTSQYGDKILKIGGAIDTLNKNLEILTEQSNEYKAELEDTAQAMSNVGVEGVTIDKTAENVPNVYEAGKKAQYDEFWDRLQNNGNPRSYNSAFSGIAWNKDTFKPKYTIIPDTTTNSALGMFRFFNASMPIDTNAKELTYAMIDMSNCTKESQVNSMFDNACMNYIEIDLSTISSLRNVFICNNGGRIYNIRAKINATNFTNNFNNCTQLKTLILEEGSVIGGNGFNVQWSTSLSHESLISILNALKDFSADTSGTTYTCTLGTTNIAKLTTEEQNIANQKGWYLA